MPDNFDETSYFRYCRTLNGGVEPIDLARRNGRLVPRFHPSVLEPEPSESPEATPEYLELVEELAENLTPLERRTWLRLLDGRSVLEIAAEDGVSRAAIYERIRGNSKNHGGMVAKNGYVAIWWRLRGAALHRTATINNERS